MASVVEKINVTFIELIQGDITELSVDVIVNAANDRLILGAGVAGAIRTKGGPAIQEECNKIGGTPVGTAVITTAGNLPAKKVIHAVGPRMGEGNEDKKLRDATSSSLKLISEHKYQSIAFPAISSGIFGFPMDRCAKIMLGETIVFLKNDTSLKEVVFCLWGNEAFGIFEKELKKLMEKRS